ncbi:MAG: hypothetical protein ACRETU_14145 [Steroidobacterales bacterium]
MVTHARKEQEGRPATEATLRYTFKIMDSSPDLRVQFVGPVVEGLALGLDDRHKMELATAGLAPDFLVKRTGEFAGLSNLEDMQTRMRAFITTTLAKDASGKDKMTPDQLERVMQMATKRELLESKVAEEWNPIVANWIDSELEVGRAYPFETKVPFPLKPSTQILMKGTITVLDQHSCKRAGIDRVCATVESRQIPDVADVARAIADLMEMAVPADKRPPGGIDSMDVSTTVRIVTEPDGLYPHEYHVTKTMEVTATEKDGAKAHTKRREERHSTYTYP